MIFKEHRVSALSLSAGLDEVGMGSLAGPLTVAVVAFKQEAPPIEGLRDSKKLSKKKREKLLPLIIAEASFVGVGWASAQLINDQGINAAWQAACKDALRTSSFKDLFVDGVRPVKGYSGAQTTVIQGDDSIWQIAAASIVAKVSRDMEMEWLGQDFPAYQWEKNAGYGTEQHINAVKQQGPCYLHRKRYLKKILER